MARSRFSMNARSVVGMLISPQSTDSLVDGSCTTRLSLGLRPVLLPERTQSAPVDVSSWRLDVLASACSTRRATDGFLIACLVER